MNAIIERLKECIMEIIIIISTCMCNNFKAKENIEVTR